jgi:hypothetical protein
MKQVEEFIKQIIDLTDEIKKLENEIIQKRSEVYGSESVDENLAATFYREIAETAPGLEKQKEALKESEKSLEELKRKLEEIKKNTYKALTNVKFPLKTGSEGIEKKNGDIVFHFDREIENAVLNEVEELLGINLSSDKVKILSNRIEVKSVDSIPDAMKQTLDQVERIRKAAMNQLKIDDYVKELKGRDEKIQKMLYVMYEAGKPLTRKEMEMMAGLEPASLRGVLYLVEKRDPYLRKLERGKFELTPLGKNVMKKYQEKYGSPMEIKEASLPSGRTLENYQSND